MLAAVNFAVAAAAAAAAAEACRRQAEGGLECNKAGRTWGVRPYGLQSVTYRWKLSSHQLEFESTDDSSGAAAAEAPYTGREDARQNALALLGAEPNESGARENSHPALR
jgi:hypothetical protein